MPEHRVLVLGVGNRLRGDDGASWEVVQRLHNPAAQSAIEVVERLYEPTDLIGAWEARDGVVIVDTMCSGKPPGTISRFDVSDRPLPARLRAVGSTHSFGLHEAIELGRALDRLPRRLIVFAVEGREFGAADALSPEVAAAVVPLVDAVLQEASKLDKP